MKPAPPVTSTFMSRLSLVVVCGVWYARDAPFVGWAGSGGGGPGGGEAAQPGGLGGRGDGPAVELDLEAEPVGEVAVVGQGEHALVRGEGQAPDEQQGSARRDLEQLGVGIAGHAGGDGLAHGGDAVPLPLQRLPDAGGGGVVPADPAREGSRHPLPDEVERLAVDAADRPAVK